MRALSIISAVALALGATAQVRVDKRVDLTGPAPSARQVIGLDPAQSPQHALDAATDQAGFAHWAGDGSGATWSVPLPALQGGPVAGTAITVRTAAPQAGAVSLLVNGNGPYPVLLGPGTPLDGMNVPAGTMLALVFDGNAFQVANGAAFRHRDCPTGLVAVNSQYCIEPEERPASDWYASARNCVQDGLRLCTWSEWEQACLRRQELGLSNMVGNWEWSNNTMNEDLFARMMGTNSCTHAGGRIATDNTVSSRCCYTR